ncbi:MAG: hypothetical protein EOS37_33390, partial [Mesorhizobium sp.]
PPLCPAGHLPLKGGDWQLCRRHPFCNAGDWRKPRRNPISPLEGGEEWSAQRTESQLLGFPNDERLERQRRAGAGRPERGA